MLYLQTDEWGNHDNLSLPLLQDLCNQLRKVQSSPSNMNPPPPPSFCNIRYSQLVSLQLGLGIGSSDHVVQNLLDLLRRRSLPNKRCSVFPLVRQTRRDYIGVTYMGLYIGVIYAGDYIMGIICGYQWLMILF